MRNAPVVLMAEGLSGELDLDVNACGQVELHERINGLLSRLQNVEEAVVGPALELLTRLFVDVRSAQDGPARDGRWQRERTPNADASALGRLNDLIRASIKKLVIVGLEPDSDLVGLGHRIAPKVGRILTPQRTHRMHWAPRQCGGRVPLVPLVR